MPKPDLSSHRNQRGATLALVTLSMAALMMAAALAVDVGLMTTARTEAQLAADMAAHAGASALIFHPYGKAEARAEAIDYASRNRIRGESVVVLPGDVEVILGESKVRVTVHRTADRGSSVSTFFARLFGIDEVDIRAEAAAVARSAGAVECLLPVAVADLWYEADGSRADENDTWDPDEGDDYRDGSAGFGTQDLGRIITLKPAQGAHNKNNGSDDGTPDSNRFMPGWWFLWYPEGGGGASALRDQILNCPQPQTPWAVGDWVTDKNGNVQSIQKAFKTLVDRDPNARWDDGCKCVKGSAFAVSPRLRPVPLFNPETYVKQGSGPNFQIADFMGVFIEPTPAGTPPGQSSTYARIATLQGIVGGGPSAGPLVKAVQIVE